MSEAPARVGGALLLAVAALAPRGADAQDGWRWEWPEPQGNTLRAACADVTGTGTDVTGVWVAGELGTLGRLVPSGAFEPAPVEATDDLYAIACCPSGVVAVGARGRVVAHRDGVVREQVLDGEPTLTDVTCVGERALAAASPSGALYVSEDGGGRFERRGAPHALYALAVLGDALVASGPAGSFARTSDLGQRWTTTRVDAPTHVLAFAAIDREPAGRPSSATELARQGERGPSTELVGVGARGLAVRSVDAGATWEPLPTGVSADLFALTRVTSGELVAVGAGVALTRRGGAFEPLGATPGRHHALASFGGHTIAVGDGGRVSTRRGRGGFVASSREAASLFAVHADARARLVVGERGFIARAAGRGPLRPLPPVTPASLHAVTMNRAGVALAVGGQGVILRSTDGGARWQRVALPARYSFTAVWLDDAGHAVCVGERGQRYWSEDAGRTWTSVSVGDDVHFAGLAWDGQALWLVASDRVERSTDLGRTWEPEPPPRPGLHLRTPFVTARGTLLMTARPGVVARRNEAGRWKAWTIRPGVLLSGITGDAERLYIVAADGASFVSDDDGVTWRQERPVTREVLTSVHAGADGRVYATGYAGTLLVRPRRAMSEGGADDERALGSPRGGRSR
ncbi:MAG: hypothetical protein KF901_28480 [Myxococcales bacterium]|nr:hypothetical protein [Myxococcales bacterium]